MCMVNTVIAVIISLDVSYLIIEAAALLYIKCVASRLSVRLPLYWSISHGSLDCNFLPQFSVLVTKENKFY